MNFKFIKILLVTTTLLTCSTISYSRNSHDEREDSHHEDEDCNDDEHDEHEERKCYLNSQEIDCSLCMQDGGCAGLTQNSYRDRIAVMIKRIFKKFKFWAGS